MLLDFEPVPRKSSPPGAWTPEAQRKFIAWLAVIGSQGKARRAHPEGPGRGDQALPIAARRQLSLGMARGDRTS